MSGVVPPDANDLRWAKLVRDLDPQFVWRGKDQQDWSDLVVQAPPLYIQEKVHPKVLIDDLLLLARSDSGQVTLDFRSLSLQEVARGWGDNPDTLLWLKECIARDYDSEFRYAAFEELAHRWKELPYSYARIS